MAAEKLRNHAGTVRWSISSMVAGFGDGVGVIIDNYDVEVEKPLFDLSLTVVRVGRCGSTSKTQPQRCLFFILQSFSK